MEWIDVFVNYSLYFSYALIILASVAAIGFPLINSLGDPKSLVKTGISLGGLLIVFGISWAISGAEVTELYTKFDVDAGLSKVIGGLLIMMYLLTGIAVVGIVYTEISKVIK